LRDACRNHAQLATKEEAIFGKQDDAGKITFGEAKVLAFPVRSARGSFAFITCPLALERFLRERGGNKPEVPGEPADMTCLAGDLVTITRNGQTGVVLEEYRFNCTATFPQDWATELLDLLDDPVWKAGKGRFVLLSNADFSHFVKNACEVSQHIKIDPKTGTVEGGFLFNLEAVPSETLFFAPVTALSRANTELENLEQLLKDKPVLQFGGDSTTGLGFCTVKLAERRNAS
jgi:CRISPR-associated protein Cmr4